ncbi:hypothetical protein KDL01_10890 [Actinospica durhamensis]|uniref:Uncharacterized protein n=1 Tax=Actinospica durhamensis TaxID=1508375 RepID=A0A941INB1_9ACTN|nr:hypothetical protein [Actinospica durhamensis]MBR7833774.1 hypothetical protein [Actinospica durhamensis]
MILLGHAHAATDAASPAIRKEAIKTLMDLGPEFLDAILETFAAAGATRSEP